jgi:HEAT repeat protein
VKAFLRDQGKIYPNPFAEALKKLGPRAKAGVAPLADALKKSEGHRAVDILGVLQAIGPPAEPAVPVMIRFLSTPTEPTPKGDKPVGPRVRVAAIGALRAVGPGARAAVPKLVSMLREDRSAGMRAQVAKALGDVAPAKEALPPLREALKDKDAGVRLAAAATLIRLTGETKGNLRHLLAPLRKPRRDNWYERYEAAQALLELGPAATRKAIPDLRAALTDDHLWVRVFAAQALGQLGEEARAAVPDLIGLLKDDDPHVRKAAVIALGQIGPAAAEAVGPLRRLREDKHEGIDRAVAEALRKVRRR